jgi:hypothetical protein
MQLKPKPFKKIKSGLALATTALLTGISPAQAQEIQAVDDITPPSKTKWTGAIANLIYSETNRVTAIEPVISLNAEFSGERKWSNKLVIDTLTGASHNGAVMSRNPQTFTSPSGNGSYVIAPGNITLDPTFKDTRFALSSSWSQPLAENYEVSLGGNASKEYDFTSASVNSSLSRYLDGKNTKLSLGLSGEFDTINPVGGAPVGLAAMSPTKPTLGNSKNKQVYDFLLGWTQVMNRRWIIQLNYNLGKSNGYMNDPYKFTSEVVAPGAGNAGDPTGTYFYDKRPGSRTKNAFFIDSKYHFGPWGIVGTNYRYFFDDWGVKSHTAEITYRVPVSSKWYVEPSFRYYIQSKADFYRYFHVQGTTLPQEMSSDYRLGDMTAMTIGFELGKALDSYGKSISFRAQLYTQSGESSPSEAYGFLTSQDLYPKLTAFVGQVIYKF